jgi:hypothetical protein
MFNMRLQKRRTSVIIAAKIAAANELVLSVAAHGKAALSL